MSASYEELMAGLLAVGFTDRGAFLSDSDYSLPDVAYLDSLGKRFRDFVFAQGLTYVPYRFDCDKYAKLVSAFAMVDHAMRGNTTTGLALGPAYIVKPASVHCVVGAFHRLNGKLVFKLYEPQPTGLECLKEISLSDVVLFTACLM